MRVAFVQYETISIEDPDVITIIDDPQEVLEIMVRHRDWKNQQRELDSRRNELIPESVTSLRHRTQALDSTAVKKIPA